MSWEETSVLDPKWTWLTGILTIFFCWMAQEILERAFGMAPAIRNVDELHEEAMKYSNPQRKLQINRRITKKLDIQGRFRITTRGTIYYIKGVWSLIMLFVSMYVFLRYPDWFIDHFIKIEPKTVSLSWYQHISASITTFYAWETVTNRYGRLNYSILFHHWLTVMASLLILLGVYTPFATWYGFTQVACLFSINLVMGIRATVSNKYPHTTRKLFTCSVWWTIITVIFNFSGQIWLLIMGFSTARISYYSCVFMIITMIGWGYDDYELVKALHDFSTHNYEDAQLYAKKHTVRELGGRLLFAQSVLNDLYDTDKEEKKNNNNNKSNSDLHPNTIDSGSEAGATNKHLKTLHGYTEKPYKDNEIHVDNHKLEKQRDSISLSQKELKDIKISINKTENVNLNQNQQQKSPSDISLQKIIIAKVNSTDLRAVADLEMCIE
eukprot:161655_1